MGSFGERMQRERELRSISLDEIAASTKIGTRLLHALEAEEFEKLPGGIFNKGFVRAYAKYLGIDEEQAVADFLAAESDQERRRRGGVDPGEVRQGQAPQLIAIEGGARPDNVYNIRASVEIVEQQPDQAGGFLMAAVIIVFVLGIGGFTYKYFAAHSVSSAAASGRSQAAAPQPVPLARSGTPPATSSSQSSAPPVHELTTPLPTPAPSDNDNIAKAQKPVPEKSTDANASGGSNASAASAVPAELILNLRAEEDSWAQITADGKPLFSGVISKDSTKDFRASKELVIKLGNAPGVQLSYNGKPLPRFSGDSKTRTLTFPADAAVQH